MPEMRRYIEIVENTLPLDEEVSFDREIILSEDELKFWYDSVKGEFTTHELDEHHTLMLATKPGHFGMSDEEVSHHPHASGEYYPDDEDEDDEDFDAEEYANDEDLGLYDIVFDKGWVRGGHEIDLEHYERKSDVRHQGVVYLQSTNLVALRKCVAACLKLWPSLSAFNIQGQHYTTLRPDEFDNFIKYGKYVHRFS